MSRMQREKGKRGERATANELREVFGEAKRGLSQSRDGSEVSDVVVPEDAMLWVEVKSGAKPNVRAALAQANAARGPMARSLVVIRDDRKPPFAAMDWAELRAILKEWWELRQLEAHLRAAQDEVLRELVS
jgi:hypothetical protein